MIAKTFLTGQTFGHTCQYCCQHQSRAQVLAAEGVRPHDYRLMAADFEWQHQLMPGKEKPVYHCVLSFSPGEQVTDELLVQLGRRFLEKVELVNTQYAFIKHTDKEHLHMHIIANKVDNDGEPTGEGLIIQRGIKAARQLTQEYGLRQEEGKNLEQTNREALHEPDGKRYRIYEAIKEQLPQCHDLNDLEKALLHQGITVRYRCDPGTGERQGISFRLENYSFKGSRVDAAYSLNRLEQTLALQEQQRQEESRRQELLHQEEQKRQEQLKQQEAELHQEHRHGLRHGF